MSRRFKLFDAPTRSHEERLAETAVAAVVVEEEAGRMHVLRNENKMRCLILQTKDGEEKFLVTPSPLSSTGSGECFDMSAYREALIDYEDSEMPYEDADGDTEMAVDDDDLMYSESRPNRRVCSFDDEESSLEAEEGDSDDEESSEQGDLMDNDAATPEARTLDHDEVEYLKEVDVEVMLICRLQVARIQWLGKEDDELAERFLDVPISTWLRLFPHQKEGVAWFWRQSCSAMTGCAGGGIMADEMGLGKTVQLLTFLEAVLHSGHGSKAIVVVPPTVLASWQAHQKAWCPKLRMATLQSETPLALRGSIIEYFRGDTSPPMVLLTTYGMLKSMNRRGQLLNNVVWDYVALDEGHFIKNTSTQLAIAAKALNSRVRFILTGTPVQNSLDEFWALYSFIDTRILGGNGAAFKRTFTEPIRKGMLRNASDAVKQTSQQVTERLRRLYAPFIIQRKKDVMNGQAEPPPKVDVVVWCSMSNLQKKVYTEYVEGNEVKECIQKKEHRGAVCMLTNLRKLCNHLWLQHSQEELASRLLVPTERTEEYGSILYDCGKLEVLCKIYEKSKEEGQRMLIFSQSVKMLSIIAAVLRCVYPDVQLMKLDGTTKMRDRQAYVDRFNNDTSIDAMLLSTGVGGVGLTLTGASRVVIFDPDWNPTKDSQAIGRAHRIGQTERVVVYRLMTCGGVEEYTYRQEIFKECIERKTTRNASVLRYFTPIELHSMFNFEPDAKKTLSQLTALQGSRRQYPPVVQAVFNEITKLTHVHGITDHDAVFTFTDPEDEPVTPQPQEVQPRLVTSPTCLSDLQVNRTPQCQAVKRNAFYDLLARSPERGQSVSSCTDLPRDDDDKEMLKSAEEAFTRMQSGTPGRSSGSLGLPPRHSSKSQSPVIRVDKCPNCDFARFPFCPVTGRPHKKVDSIERADSVSSRATGCSPPLHPQNFEDALLALATDGQVADDLCDISMTNAPVKLREHRDTCSLLTASSAERELSFGCAERDISLGGISFGTAPFDSVSRSLSVPGAPCRTREGLGSLMGAAQRELSYASSASCRSASGDSAPGAPFRQHQRESFNTKRGLSFGSLEFGKASPSPNRLVCTSQRELSFATESMGTCYSSPGTKHETPQGYNGSQFSVPGAPLRVPCRSGSGNSSLSANSGVAFKSTAVCERLSMSSSNFVSPAPRHLGTGIRRRAIGTRCSESTSSDVDEGEFLHIPDRSVSGSHSEESLFIHHASMTTPPPF